MCHGHSHPAGGEGPDFLKPWPEAACHAGLHSLYSIRFGARTGEGAFHGPGILSQGPRHSCEHQEAGAVTAGSEPGAGRSLEHVCFLPGVDSGPGPLSGAAADRRHGACLLHRTPSPAPASCVGTPVCCDLHRRSHTCIQRYTL